MKTKKKIICTILVFCMILCIFPVSIFVSASYLPADGISSGKVYFIMNVNSGKCFDVSAGNTANGSDVAQYTYTPSCEWQQWKITYCGNGDYTITDMHSGKLLSVEGSSSADNANAWIWQYDGTDGQFFRIRKNSDGTYTFLSKCSGYTKALGVYNESTENGYSILQQSGDNGSANQKYYIFVSNTATYNIQNVNSGKCLDVSGGSLVNSSRVSQLDYTPSTQWQKWRILYVGDGNYILVDSNSGNLLTVGYDNIIHDYWVYMSSDGNPTCQQYKLITNLDGTYTFLTRYSNYSKALCILNNGIENGDVIYQETYNSNSNNQKFNIFLSQNVYHIKNFNSDKCLDVSAGNTANGSDVAQYTFTPSCEWQSWQITYCGDGDYKIKDMHSGKLLSVEGSSSATNANVWIWQEDGTVGQRFRIRRNDDGTVTFLTKASNYTKAIGIYEEGLLNGDTVVQQSNDDGSDNQKFVLVNTSVRLFLFASGGTFANNNETDPNGRSTFGHAWLKIVNTSDININGIGHYSHTIKYNEAITIGRWGDFSSLGSKYENDGIWYNLENRKMLEEGIFTNNVATFIDISFIQLAYISNEAINTYSEYDLDSNNCVDFAVNCWNNVSNEDIAISSLKDWGSSFPEKLEEKIKSDFRYVYDIPPFTPYSFGYYNGETFHTPED